MITFVLEPIQKALGKYTMAVGYTICALGILIVPFHPTLATCIAGCIISGAGFMISFSMLQVYNAAECKPEQIGLASTLLLAGNQVGIFVSNYFIVFFHAIFNRNTDIESALLGAVICIGLSAVLALIPGAIVPKDAPRAYSSS